MGLIFSTTQSKVLPQKRLEESVLTNKTNTTSSTSKSVEKTSSIDQYSILATADELNYFRALDIATTYNDFEALIAIVADEHADMLQRSNSAGALAGFAMLSTANQIAIAEGGAVPALTSLLQRNNFPANINAVKALRELLRAPANHDAILTAGAMQSLLLLLSHGSGVATVLNEAVLSIISIFAVSQSIPLVATIMTFLHERRITAISAALAIVHVISRQGYESRLANAGAIDVLIMYVMTAKEGDHVEVFLTCLNAFESESSKLRMLDAGILPVILAFISTGVCMPQSLLVLLNIAVKCDVSVKNTIVLSGGVMAMCRLLDQRVHSTYAMMALAALTQCSVGVDAVLSRFNAFYSELGKESDEIALDSLLRVLCNILTHAPIATVASPPDLSIFIFLLRSTATIQSSALTLLQLMMNGLSSQNVLQELRESQVMGELLALMQRSESADIVAKSLQLLQPLIAKDTVHALEVLNVPDIVLLARKTHPSLHKMIDAFVQRVEMCEDGLQQN